MLAEASQTHHIGPEAAGEGRAQHQQQQDRTGFPQQLFNRVEEAPQGGVENRRNARAAAGRHDHPQQGGGRLEPAGHLPAHGTAHLNRRTFRAEREATADGQDPGQQFDDGHLQVHRQALAREEAHHLRDARAGRRRRQGADQHGREQAADPSHQGQDKPRAGGLEQPQAPAAQPTHPGLEQQARRSGPEAGDDQGEDDRRPALLDHPLEVAAGPPGLQFQLQAVGLQDA